MSGKRYFKLWVRVLGLVGVMSLSYCARTIPLAPEHAVRDVQELQQRMLQTRSPLDAYSADVRVSYFGSEGRVRTSASLLVSRPNNLRYDLQAPHGGVMQAFATDGNELQWLDLANNRYLYGRATPNNVDRLLGVAPLTLSPAAWVDLFFGELRILDAAQLRYDDAQGVYVARWRDGDRDWSVGVNPQTARVVWGRVEENGQEAWHAAINERDAHGLPVSLEIRAASAEHLRLTLRDIAPNPQVEDDVFVLHPPRGIVPEHLD